MPGGKLEYGEHVLLGGKREVKEETAQECTILKELLPVIHTEEGILIQTRVFLATIPITKITLSKEHSEYCWKTMSEIEKMENVIYKELLLKYLEEVQS